MIIFVTTRNHTYTVRSLVERSFGPPVPHVRVMAWENIFYARQLPRATYVFSDLERLSASELFNAAKVYRSAIMAGLRCLNDPAKVRHRFSLLRVLHAAGYNPFNVYRAEASPRPIRFPVFIRNEADHGAVEISGLIADQAALEAALAQLERAGVPLRFMVVIEFCAAPIAPGVWRKFGTFRIGPAMHMDHAVIEDNWLVKQGTKGLSTPAMFAAEREAVAANANAEAVRAAFDVGRIDYGRADHATVNGREVVYEINTNPYIHPQEKQRSPIRDETMTIGRARFATLLAEVDTPAGGKVSISPALHLPRRYRAIPWAQHFGLLPKTISRN